MRTLGPRLAAAIGALAAVLLAASCSSSADPAGDGGGATPDAQAGSPAASAFTLSLASLRSAETPVTADIGPRAGGTLTATLPSGAVATLTFEAASVDRRTTMTLVPFADGDVEGVLLGPAGAWLAKPAHLVFTNTDRTAAIRVGLTDDGAAVFAEAPRSADGSIVVIRLRPVVLLEESAGPLSPAPGSAGQVAGGDPLDDKATEEEADEADRPDGDTAQDEAAQEATERVADVSSRCGPGAPAAAVQALEAWRTAGSVGTPPTACAQLVADVLASVEIAWKGFPSTFQEVVRARGSGPIIDDVSDLDLPAEREVSGIDAMASYLNTTVGITLAQGLFGAAQGARPSEDTCHLGPIPQGSVGLETVPLPDGALRVTLTPKQGPFTILCDDMPPAEVEALVWDYLRDVLGIGEDKPITVTTTVGEQVHHVLSSVRSVEGAKARPDGAGGITIKDSGITLHALLDVHLRYEAAS